MAVQLDPSSFFFQAVAAAMPFKTENPRFPSCMPLPSLQLWKGEIATEKIRVSNDDKKESWGQDPSWVLLSSLQENKLPFLHTLLLFLYLVPGSLCSITRTYWKLKHWSFFVENWEKMGEYCCNRLYMKLNCNKPTIYVYNQRIYVVISNMWQNERNQTGIYFQSALSSASGRNLVK